MRKLTSSVVAILVGLACLLPQAEGQVAVSFAPSSQSVTLPQNGGFSRKSGMSLSFTPQWANNYGYHPLQLAVKALAPAKADRVVRVVLRSGSWNDRWGSMTASQEAVLPAGSTSVSMTIDLPMYQSLQWANGGYYSWEFYVDNVPDKYLAMERGMGGFYSGNQPAERSVLVVGAANASRQPIIAANTQYELLYLPVADLPSRWLEYTSLDVIALSLSDLQAAATTNSQALLAIRRWMRAGGQLWITNVGANWEQLVEAEKILGLPAPSTDKEDAADAGFNDKAIAERGWRSIQPWPENWNGRRVLFTDRRNQSQIEARDPAEIDRLTRDPNYYVTDDRTISMPSMPGAQKGAKNDSLQYFVEQPIGFGKARLFRGNEAIAAWKSWQSVPPSTPGQTAQFTVTNGSVTMQSTVQTGSVPTQSSASPASEPISVRMAMEAAPTWTARHGMSPDQPNAEFSEWLLPGVGMAPVTEFRVLITLFVLVIGPLNYLLLRRFRRLYLLVITVPLAAALLTLALFSYALISDGLGIKARVRSVTMLDQRSGEAASWARLSYYAGLAPADGLAISTETAIYPILPDWYGTSGAEMGVARSVEWDSQAAQLTRGWLRSRTPTQYLAVRAHSSPLRLQLRSGEGRLAAKNDLATQIQYVVAADADGNMFAGSDIPDGATTELTPTDRATVSRRIGEFLRDHFPEAPPELSTASRAQYAGGMLINSPYYYYGRYGNTVGRLSDNLMQQTLNRWTRFDSEIVANIPSRSFIAVTATGPDVEIGIKNIQEEDSFHVIIGTW